MTSATAVIRLLLRGVAVGLVLVVAGATTATADPPGPTAYESAVSNNDDLPDGVSAEVLGGDSFLQVQVAPGHEVVVPGYDGDEQYLRIDADGSVWVNRRSETHWLNEDRYAGGAVPDGVGAGVPPEWTQVGTDGTWAWHDHRIHWMSPVTLPGGVDPTAGTAQTAIDEQDPWVVPIIVDGATTEVTGTLVWHPPSSPLVAAVGALAMVVLAGVVARRSRLRSLAAMVVLAGGVTALVGAARLVGLPAGVQGEPLPLVLSVVALVVAGAGLAVRHTAAGAAIAALAGIPLVVWGGTNWAAATAHVVPPELVPDVVGRASVGIAIGAGLVMVVMGAWEAFSTPLDLESAEPSPPG